MEDKEISPDIIADLLQKQLDRLKSEFKLDLPAKNLDLKGMLEYIEKQAIVQALNEEKNNQSQAAKRLGMTRQNFKKKLEKYSIAT